MLVNFLCTEIINSDMHIVGSERIGPYTVDCGTVLTELQTSTTKYTKIANNISGKTAMLDGW